MPLPKWHGRKSEQDSLSTAENKYGYDQYRETRLGGQLAQYPKTNDNSSVLGTKVSATEIFCKLKMLNQLDLSLPVVKADEEIDLEVARIKEKRKQRRRAEPKRKLKTRGGRDRQKK